MFELLITRKCVTGWLWLRLCVPFVFCFSYYLFLSLSGYDRDIPGYPTYSVIGSDPREFNLMIVNTQLRDDAEYQCQVTPGGPNDPRLTASAQLTVLGQLELEVFQVCLAG